MKTRVLLLILGLASAAHAIDFKKATPEELAMKSVDIAPGAPAVVLDWVQRTDDVNSEASKYVRIKILTEQGRKYADVEIPYLPEIARISGIDARMTRPDGTIVPFAGKIYDKLVIKTNGLRVMAKTFTFADVQPGSILEYRYYLGTRDKQVLRDSAFVLQRELPVLHASLWLRPYVGQYSSFFVHRGLPPGKEPVHTGGHFELEVENIPAFEEEEYAPPEGELKTAVNFFYVEGPMDPGGFWTRHGKTLTAAVEKFIGDPKAVLSAATAAVGDAAGAEAKLRRLYLRAQQLRNLDYEESRTEAEEKNIRENKSAEEVLASGYGDSTAISRTFAAMARAAGFEANQVRVGTRNESYFAQNVPMASQLDAEVTLVMLDGKERWLDAGTPGAPFGVLAWHKSDVQGLLLTKKNPAAWVKSPEQTPADGKVARKAALRMEGGVVKGTVTATYSGHEALLRRIRNHNDDDAAARKSFEETAKRWLPEATVKLTNLTGLKSIDDPVVATFDVELPALGASTGSRALLPLSVFATSAKNPFAPAQRRHPIVFPRAWTEEDDVTLRVPDGFAVESLPNGTAVDAGALVYRTRYSLEDDGKTVHFARTFRMSARFFDTDSYPAIRKLFGNVVAADQEQVVLKK